MLRCRKSFWILALVIGGLVPALHADNGDQVHLARRIVVEQNETAGNLVCIGCAIRMHGTSQDIVAIGGSIDIDGEVTGDVVSLGGSIRLGENAEVSGDVDCVGGSIWRHSNAIVRGSMASQSGVIILAGLVLAPLLPLAFVIVLIVWLVRRNQRPTPIRG